MHNSLNFDADYLPLLEASIKIDRTWKIDRESNFFLFYFFDLVLSIRFFSAELIGHVKLVRASIKTKIIVPFMRFAKCSFIIKILDVTTD